MGTGVVGETGNLTGVAGTTNPVLFGFLIARNVLSLLIIGANLLTVVAVYRFKRMRTPTNYVVVSLAVADVIIGLLNPCLLALDYVSSYSTWRGLCLAEEVLDVISTAGGAFSIVLIAIDRYIHVVRYLTYQDVVTKCRLVPVLVCVWLYIIAASVALIVCGNNIRTRMRCSWTVFITKRVYMGVVLPHVIILTLIVVSVYCAIMFFLRKQRLQMSQNRAGSGQGSPVGFARTNRMMGTVVWFYCLANIPTTVVSIFVTETSSFELVVTQQILILLWYFNSCINPIFYAWQNPEFRIAFRRLLKFSDKPKIHDTDASSTRMTGLPGYNTTTRMTRTTC